MALLVASLIFMGGARPIRVSAAVAAGGGGNGNGNNNVVVTVDPCFVNHERIVYDYYNLEASSTYSSSSSFAAATNELCTLSNQEKFIIRWLQSKKKKREEAIAE